MLKLLRGRWRDMRTVAALCDAAEGHARAKGQQHPGSEHFLLAALDLPDGSAKRVFARIGVDAEHLASAIAQQYVEALDQTGIDAAYASRALAPEPLPSSGTLPPPAAESGRALLARLSRGVPSDLAQRPPLTGAVVVAAVADERHSVAARALRAMNVDLGELRRAALADISGR